MAPSGPEARAARSGRWRRYAGVRRTTALAGALVVAVALGLGGVLLVVLLQRNLTQGVRNATEQRAQDLAGALASGGLARVSLFSRGAERSVAQVLQAGQVVLSSPDVAGQPALSPLRPKPGVLLQRDTGRLTIDEDEDHSVAAVGVHGADGHDYVVVVAQSLAEVSAALTALTTLLAVGIPALVLLVAASSFLLVGRALRPVESIRRQVAAIDATGLTRRVPVPPGQDEIYRLAVTMNHMLDRLESAASGQRQFASDASHELRSPLANVRATVEVAQAHPRTADWPQISRIVLEETGRLQALVADLLLLARDDEHGLHLRRGDVDLDDLLRQEADRLSRSGRLAVVVELVPVRVSGDRQRLARVVRNLVDNAERHAHGQVQLTLRPQAGMAVIEIADDGDGIPATERERVFQRFVRLDGGRDRHSGGTGLGLAIVRQLVTAHGGTVRILDADRPGTIVRLQLPLTVA